MHTEINVALEKTGGHDCRALQLAGYVVGQLLWSGNEVGIDTKFLWLTFSRGEWHKVTFRISSQFIALHTP